MMSQTAVEYFVMFRLSADGWLLTLQLYHGKRNQTMWIWRCEASPRWFCVAMAALCMTWRHFFVVGPVLLWTHEANKFRMHRYVAVSSARNFLFFKEISKNCFVFSTCDCTKWRCFPESCRFGAVSFHLWGSLAELLRLLGLYNFWKLEEV